MVRPGKQNPMDDLLRARLRIAEGADLRLKALRLAMQGVDGICQTFMGQAFFALRETEQVLIELGDRTGHDLVKALLAMKGGTRITAHGLHNIPPSGAVVIGATHPIGTFDFIAHAGALMDHRPDLKVVANREAERFLGAGRIIAVDLDRRDRVLTSRQTRDGMLGHLNGHEGRPAGRATMAVRHHAHLCRGQCPDRAGLGGHVQFRPLLPDPETGTGPQGWQ